MTDSVSAYLAELENALQNAPADLRAEILAGVREELDGLPADEVRARLADFGDPAFIAAEATSAMPVTPRKPEPAWLSVLAALLVMLGGLIVPFVGALAGFVLMWISSAWTRRVKLIATLAPVVTVIVIGAVVAIVAAMTPDPTSSGGSGGHAIINPLIPGPVDGITVAFLGGFVALLVDGIVLLVRRKR